MPVVQAGRGQAVGHLPSRFIWRRTTREPIRQLAGYPRVAIVQRSPLLSGFGPPFCRCPPACSNSVMFPEVRPLLAGLAMRGLGVTQPRSLCAGASVTVTFAVPPLPVGCGPVLGMGDWFDQPERTRPMQRGGEAFGEGREVLDREGQATSARPPIAFAVLPPGADVDC